MSAIERPADVEPIYLNLNSDRSSAHLSSDLTDQETRHVGRRTFSSEDDEIAFKTVRESRSTSPLDPVHRLGSQDETIPLSVDHSVESQDVTYAPHVPGEGMLDAEGQHEKRSVSVGEDQPETTVNKNQLSFPFVLSNGDHQATAIPKQDNVPIPVQSPQPVYEPPENGFEVIAKDAGRSVPLDRITPLSVGMPDTSGQTGLAIDNTRGESSHPKRESSRPGRLDQDTHILPLGSAKRSLRDSETGVGRHGGSGQGIRLFGTQLGSPGPPARLA
jgi:hypothetical protein